jgi:hypothetical protein
MHIGEVLNGVYDDDIGWRPASGSIKPVHVANGLFRAVQNAHYDVGDLGTFSVWWKAGKVVDDSRSFEKLGVSESRERYGALARSRPLFEKTRRYASGLLTADKAVFPTADQSSFTLTHGRMVTRDHNDRKLGDWVSLILDGTPEYKAFIRECLTAEKPRDPLTAFVWPLLPGDSARVDRRSDGRVKAPKAQGARHNKAIFDQLTLAAKDLFTHEAAQRNQLRSLQRAVQFACVATHVHAQALASNGVLEKRPPALIAMVGHKRSDLATASEASLNRLYLAFERWLGDQLAKRIQRGVPLASDSEGDSRLEINDCHATKVRSILKTIYTATKPHGAPDEDVVTERAKVFTAVRQEYGQDNPAQVLGHTLVRCYLDEYESGGPEAFLQGLGRRVGLLYPHFQGRSKDKRIRPSVPLLDMLVRACVPAGELIDLDSFLSRLWDRFGLVVGGRRSTQWDDMDFLEKSGLSIDLDELSANTEGFIDELSVMGLARRYADGVTFVGDAYEG